MTHPRSPRQLLGLVAALVYHGSLSLAGAQPTDLEVRCDQAPAIETEGRRIVTTVFRVANLSSGQRELEGKLTLPAGWTTIATELPFELAPRATDVRMVSFLVPQGARAGRYEVAYGVRDRRVPSLSDSWAISVVVRPNARLAFQIVEAPARLIAGTTRTARLLLTNPGNVGAELALRVASGELTASLSPRQITLQPGASATVTVTLAADKRFEKQSTVGVTVVAEATGAKASREERTFLVKVLPRSTAADDPYVEIPSRATVRYAGGSGSAQGAGLQVELAGAGALDERGRKTIDFQLRGPDLRSGGTLGDMDAYRMSYSEGERRYDIGDRTWSLSGLLEAGRFGRGVGAESEANGFLFGAYTMEDRDGTSPVRETGVHVERRLARDQRVRVNALDKASDGRGHGSVSVEAYLKPRADTSVEVEMATGNGASASRGRASGRIGAATWSASHHRAEPGFPGYFEDSESLAGAVAFPVGQRLRLRSSYSRNLRNLDLVAAEPAPEQVIQEHGLEARLTRRTSASVAWTERLSADRLATPSQSSNEHGLQLSLNHSLGSVSLNARAELGEVVKDAVPGSLRYRRFTTALAATPSRTLKARLQAELREQDTESGVVERGLSGSLGLTWSPRPRLQVGLDVRRDRRETLYTSFRDYFQAFLRQELRDGTRIELVARNTRMGESDTTDRQVLLQYSLPFNLRAGRRSGGTVQGFVRDATTGSPVRDMVITVGTAMSVTDARGRFILRNLPAGTYPLTMEPADEGTSAQVCLQALPLQVTVVRRKTTRVELEMTEGATISGRMRLKGTGAGVLAAASADAGDRAPMVGPDGRSVTATAPATDVGPVPGVLVVATCGEKTLRRITDGRGEFCFRAVTPGAWTLTVEPANLPAGHALAQAEAQVMASPGQEAVCDFEVVPVLRRVRMIDGGRVGGR